MAGVSKVTVVDPNVSRTKLGRELEAWRRNDVDYRRKGWILLRADLEELVVDIAFLALLPLSGNPVPIVAPAIRLGYDNYDLWPPTLTFIDVFTGRPARSPVSAFMQTDDGQLRSILMERDGKQFLCLRGTREYHEHPDHDGDRWELYRGDKAGALAVICDRVSSSMTSLVAGAQFQMQVTLLTPSAGMPFEAARQAALQGRNAYDAQVDAYGAQIQGGGA